MERITNKFSFLLVAGTLLTACGGGNNTTTASGTDVTGGSVAAPAAPAGDAFIRSCPLSDTLVPALQPKFGRHPDSGVVAVRQPRCPRCRCSAERPVK
jgi:hypothetical protein